MTGWVERFRDYLLVAGTLIILLPVAVTAQPTYDQAREVENQGNHSEALYIYQRILREQPQHLRARRGALRSAVRTHNWDTATNHLNQLERRDPGKARTALWGTRLYYRQDLNDTALIWARRYRNRAPADWRGFHIETRVQLERGSYLAAEQQLRKARARAPNQPWVLVDSIELTVRTTEMKPTEEINRLLNMTAPPTAYWTVLQRVGDRLSRDQVRSFLQLALENFPEGEPPIVEPVEESTIRYWLARFRAISGDTQPAYQVVRPSTGVMRNRWLFYRLRDSEIRIPGQHRILQSHPDHTVYLWQHSRDLRQHRPVHDPLREEASDWLYEQFNRVRYWGLQPAQLSAITRSLELDPASGQRQFELARMLHDWGWLKTERQVVQRVSELGIRPTSKITDYRDGLAPLEGPHPGELRTGEVLIGANVQSDWEGPYGGARVLRLMANQALYHQPAFEPETAGDTPGTMSEFMEGRPDSGGLIFRVQEWDGELRARIDVRFPGGEFYSEQFQHSGPLKEWRLINRAVNILRNRWPWEGRLYEVDWPHGWLDLGRVHGITDDETFMIDEQEFAIQELYEDRLKLEFPSPVERTLLQRGTRVPRQ